MNPSSSLVCCSSFESIVIEDTDTRLSFGERRRKGRKGKEEEGRIVELI